MELHVSVLSFSRQTIWNLAVLQVTPGWTSVNTQLFSFTDNWVLHVHVHVQTNQWCGHGYQNGTWLGQSFCRLHWTPIIQPIQQPQSWTLLSLHCYFLYQRGTQSIYNCCQFVSSGSQVYLGNFQYFFKLAFLDIKVSIEVNGLCTSVHYKPTDSYTVVISCIHLHIHHMPRIVFIPFLILSL